MTIFVGPRFFNTYTSRNHSPGSHTSTCSSSANSSGIPHSLLGLPNTHFWRNIRGRGASGHHCFPLLFSPQFPSHGSHSGPLQLCRPGQMLPQTSCPRSLGLRPTSSRRKIPYAECESAHRFHMFANSLAN